jgi:hypothetical protein
LVRLTHCFFNYAYEVGYTKGFLDTGRAGSTERRRGLFVCDIAGDKNQFAGKRWTVGRDPGINLRSINAAGRPHIRNHAMKLAARKKFERASTRVATHNRVPIALKGGANKNHDGGLVLNQKHGRACRFRSSVRHFG